MPIIEVEPVAHVVGGRAEPTDDYWGGVRSIIRVDPDRFGLPGRPRSEDAALLRITRYRAEQLVRPAVQPLGLADRAEEGKHPLGRGVDPLRV